MRGRDGLFRRHHSHKRRRGLKVVWQNHGPLWFPQDGSASFQEEGLLQKLVWKPHWWHFVLYNYRQTSLLCPRSWIMEPQDASVKIHLHRSLAVLNAT